MDIIVRESHSNFLEKFLQETIIGFYCWVDRTKCSAKRFKYYWNNKIIIIEMRLRLQLLRLQLLRLLPLLLLRLRLRLRLLLLHIMAYSVTPRTQSSLQHCTVDFWHDTGSRGGYLIFNFICATEQEYFAQAVRLILLHFSKLVLREPI